MKIFILSTIGLIMSVFSYGQINKSINYYLPDSVEVRAESYITSKKSKGLFFIYLETIKSDTFKIFICQYNGFNKGDSENWVSLSNRKIVIGRKLYKIIFDYDYLFGTANDSKTGSLGDRSNITRLLPLYHAFNIKFTKKYILDEQNNIIGYANKQHYK